MENSVNEMFDAEVGGALGVRTANLILELGPAIQAETGWREHMFTVLTKATPDLAVRSILLAMSVTAQDQFSV